MTMSDRKSNDSRRKLLKSFAAGSGAVVAGKSIPGSWTKPVINAVMLPAHASTTDDTGSGGPEVTTTAAPGVTTQEPCNQCGELFLVDGIGTNPGWQSLLVRFNSSVNTYRFHNAGSNMNQAVSLDSSCIGRTLRLSFGDGGFDGPLRVSIVAGNAAESIIYTGGGLAALDIVITDYATPARVFFSVDSLPFDDRTTIISPTLTMLC